MKKKLHFLTLFLAVVFLAGTLHASDGTRPDPPNYVLQSNYDDIRVYPNPATDYIMVSENETAQEVWIYNVVGRKVKSYIVEEGLRYDIRDLPKGTYIVRLVTAEGGLVATRRINKVSP